MSTHSQQQQQSNNRHKFLTPQQQLPDANGRFQCPNCGRFYLRLYCLNRHLRVECGKAPSFQCQICRGWFKYKHNLVAHMKLHVEQPKFACALCTKKFHRRDKLAEHEKKYHGAPQMP